MNQLELIVKQRSVALISGDVAKLSAILSDDFVYIDAGGNLMDKRGYLENYVMATDVRWIAQELDEIVIREYGEMAVITLRAHDQAEYGGTLFDSWVRSTFVYAKQGENWRCVSGHSSRILT
ncbi:MAG: nuclear transport factor 2 family protein [Anaerolineae bacterium]|nr:nuclear transport factor 2 family protein [Anaerolineae bacterium]